MPGRSQLPDSPSPVLRPLTARLRLCPLTEDDLDAPSG